MQVVSIAHVKSAKAQYAEPRSGADWEWHFIASDGQWFGIRVQAKRGKLSGTAWGYKAIGSPRSGKATYQIDDLIADAGNVYWPAYAFYDSRFQDKSKKLAVCDQCPRLHSWFAGMTCADANDVNRLRHAGTLDRDTVRTISAPIPCLFDCASAGGSASSLAHRARAFAVELSRRNRADGTHRRDPPPVQAGGLPSHVLAILERAATSAEAPVVFVDRGESAAETEDSPFTRLAGIVIIKERKELVLSHPRDGV